MSDAQRKQEILAMAGMFQSLDYYQVLKVDRKAPAPEIKKAFIRESMTWHPDRFYASNDEQLKDAVMNVYKRIAEAYGVLKDADLRPRYDAQLATGAGTRFDRREAEKATAQAGEPKAKNPQAQRYVVLAMTAFRKQDFAGAIMNFQFALKYEPGNASVEAKLKESQERAKAKEAANPKDPYRIA